MAVLISSSVCASFKSTNILYLKTIIKLKHNHLLFSLHIIYIYVYLNVNNMKGSYLGEFEEIVLLAVTIQHEEAYRYAIPSADESANRTKRKSSAVHSALHRLEKKEFLSSRLARATKRSRKRRRFFTMTKPGKRPTGSTDRCASGCRCSCRPSSGKPLNPRPMNTSPPPYSAVRLLRWHCHPELLEEIQEDLYEAYADQVARHGIGYARLLYIRDVLSY